MEDQKKPFPKEVEIKEEGLFSMKTQSKEEKLVELAKVVRRNQESIQILKLELSDKERVIKEIVDKMEMLKIRRPPIRPPYFYQKAVEENPYIEDDFDYWQVESVKPSPLPKSWLINLEKQSAVNSARTDIAKDSKLPKIMSKQSHYRSNSTNKALQFKKPNK